MGDKLELLQDIGQLIEEWIEERDDYASTVMFLDEDNHTIKAVYDIGGTEEKQLSARAIEDIYREDIEACFGSADPRRIEFMERINASLAALHSIVSEARRIVDEEVDAMDAK